MTRFLSRTLQRPPRPLQRKTEPLHRPLPSRGETYLLDFQQINFKKCADTSARRGLGAQNDGGLLQYRKIALPLV